MYISFDPAILLSVSYGFLIDEQNGTWTELFRAELFRMASVGTTPISISRALAKLS